ncbi:MAG TPA: YciI family protein [Polyangiaceae bacterium]|nr:YciI family protein [Polyangiaceae bacterium]
MFVIELTYKVDLSEIDAHMASHVTFLKRQYAAGSFLVSGRKIPRDGGIILALAQSRADVEALMQQDPFVKLGLADVRIIEFRASQRAADLPRRWE